MIEAQWNLSLSKIPLNSDKLSVSALGFLYPEEFEETVTILIN